MESAAKRLRKWVDNNDWYSIGVLTNELKFNQQFGRHIRKVTLQLDYHGKNIIAAQIQKSLSCLLDKCRKIDDVCHAGCRDQEQLLELDFIRTRAKGLVNALAELLEMAETNVTPKPEPKDRVQPAKGDEWISLSKSGRLLGVSPGTVSRLISKGLVKDNGQKGRKRKVSKTSVLIEKERRDNLELMNT